MSNELVLLEKFEKKEEGTKLIQYLFYFLKNTFGHGRHVRHDNCVCHDAVQNTTHLLTRFKQVGHL